MKKTTFLAVSSVASLMLLTGCTSSQNNVSNSSMPKIVQKNDSWYAGAQKTIQEKLARTPITKKAKNVILLVADGNGVGSNYATRLYMGQKAGGYGDEFVMPKETLPYLALVKTYNTNAQTPDSAGTATAMNTGVKTKAGIIGLSDKARRSKFEDVQAATVTNFAELMSAKGKSVGVVSTARLTHATPAAVYAHSADRNWEDDSKLPEGSTQKDIATQLIEKMSDGTVDIALGGGRRHFIPKTFVDEEGKKGKRKDGQNLISKAKDKGFQYAWDDKTFASLNLDGKTPVLGLFESSHMKYDYDRANEPSLADMTATAIKYLSKNKNGYYLEIEAGRVDHANHDGNAFRTVTDGEAFSKAVKTALEMTNPEETLVIVTADHEHAIAFSGYSGRGAPILGLSMKINSDGTKYLNEANLADDGKPYTTIGFLNGTGSVFKKQKDGTFKASRAKLTQKETMDPDFIQEALIPKSSETHSGEDVAVYARGPWAHLFDGTVEQNYIFHVMNYAVNTDK